jgi:hypothetical protein
MCTLSFYETYDPKQLANIAMKWAPLVKYSFVQVVEDATVMNSWLEAHGKK